MDLVLEENARLREELNDCESRLMALSGSIGQITDADVRQNFEDLHSLIESALDKFLDLDGQFTGWDKTSHRKLDQVICKSVAIPQDLLSPQLWEPLDTDKRPSDGLEWLSEQKCCDCTVVCLIVWRFLERRVFSSSNLLSDPEFLYTNTSKSEDSDFVQEIFLLLAKDGRDVVPASITPFWKPEALKAVSQLPGFIDRQKRLAESLASALRDELQECISIEEPNELNHFCYKCVCLALDLVINMACASQTYEISRGQASQAQMMTSDLKSWKLRSISSWRTPQTAVGLQPVITLTPGLYNVTRIHEGSASVALVKPLLVVFEDGPTKIRVPVAVVDDAQASSLGTGVPTAVEVTENTLTSRDKAISGGSSSPEFRRSIIPAGRRTRSEERWVKSSQSHNKSVHSANGVAQSQPVSPQKSSRTSRTVEKRKKGRRNPARGKLDYAEVPQRQDDKFPRQEASRSPEYESSGSDSETDSIGAEKPLVSNAHAFPSAIEVHRPFTYALLPHAATYPGDGSHSPTGQVAVREASKDDSRGVYKPKHQQRDTKGYGVRVTKHEAPIYSAWQRNISMSSGGGSLFFGKHRK